MEDFIEQPCVKALLNYEQADADGIMVLTPRQAIHETIELIQSLQDHMIQEFEKMLPKWEDLPDTNPEHWEGFNQAMSIVVEKLNNLKK